MVRYTVDEFVRDLKSILVSEANVNKIVDRGSVLLERLIRNPNCVPEEYRTPGDSDIGRYLLYREAPQGLSVSALVWGPGSHLGPHDHHTWGMVGVVSNQILETRFRRLDDTSNKAYAHLEKDRAGTLKPGQVALLVPGVDEIHQMDNPTDRPTVEIHVYGHDLAGLKRCLFDVETGQILPYVAGTYHNE